MNEEQDCKELEEQTLEFSEYTFEPIGLNIDNVGSLAFNKEEFGKGIKDISYVCGMLTGLKNIGLTWEDAMNFLINRDTIKHNIDIAKINSDAQIKVAEKQSVLIEKNQL